MGQAAGLQHVEIQVDALDDPEVLPAAVCTSDMRRCLSSRVVSRRRGKWRRDRLASRKTPRGPSTGRAASTVVDAVFVAAALQVQAWKGLAPPGSSIQICWRRARVTKALAAPGRFQLQRPDRHRPSPGLQFSAGSGRRWNWGIRCGSMVEQGALARREDRTAIGWPGQARASSR